ncbi:hypothetical protein [Oceaniglobus trochenteri]|uniref:hypothetical protein n=1 Tax=Oceaniglobus trochenteri TaxID=2763260 RepID=UPI001CFFA2B5|nr:hypothetical protein [Oceaniglobus trochenteri]
MPNDGQYPRLIGPQDMERVERTSLADLKSGGGGGTSDGMETRLALLEAKVTGLEREFAVRFDHVEKRFDDLSRDISKLPTEWGMAKIVFVVTGALMAAAIWGPRALSLIAPTVAP